MNCLMGYRLIGKVKVNALLKGYIFCVSVFGCLVDLIAGNERLAQFCISFSETVRVMVFKYII